MTETMLYFECFSGISGDMTVSALLDLGADRELLLLALKSLNLEGYQINITRKQKCGIDACHFDVILEENHYHNHTTNPNHPYEYPHTHPHVHPHSHPHVHPHAHPHVHPHEHPHRPFDIIENPEKVRPSHDHRNIKDIVIIIDSSDLSENAKTLAKKMFHFVAKAEAKAHNLPFEDVHFHEVGAVDSIVDIVAVAVCIDSLGIEKVCISTVYEGQGYVKCQHGTIPVPVPAVVNIAQEKNIKLRITDNRGEMITPTGMAIVAALKSEDTVPKEFSIKKVGIGCGKKDFPQANILRIMEIEIESEKIPVLPVNQIQVLETNVDDCSAESLAFTMELLMKKGANDVFFTPIFMKKNRPATKLTVLCSVDMSHHFQNIIFTHLPTIGIRHYICDRTMLPRKEVEIETSLGKILFKICEYNGKTYGYPEYESVKSLCLEKNLSFDKTFTLIKSEFKQ